MGITIQINNLDALLHLLGAEDDGELEIHIRQAVIEAFGQRFVKSVANAEAVAAQVQALRDAVEQEVDKAVQNVYGQEHGFKLHGDRIVLKDSTKALITTTVREAVQDEVREQLVAMNLQEITKTIADQRMLYHVDIATKKYINDELKALVQRRVSGLFHPKVGNE